MHKVENFAAKRRWKDGSGFALRNIAEKGGPILFDCTVLHAEPSDGRAVRLCVGTLGLLSSEFPVVDTDSDSINRGT